MKSGPILNGCTDRPFLLNACIIASETVVLPTPLVVPAITSDGRELSKELMELLLVNQYLSY